jgi:hypothetical protein
MDMDLREYFENVKGHGVLATADAEGKVDAAIYGKPHFMDDGSIAFIMADRLTHANLQSNNHAAYLFKEKGKGYKGIRLTRFLVFFNVDKVLPLIGAGEETVEGK